MWGVFNDYLISLLILEAVQLWHQLAMTTEVGSRTTLVLCVPVPVHLILSVAAHVVHHYDMFSSLEIRLFT